MNVLKPHVSLNVSNIDESVAFYEKAFGVPATKRRPGYAKFDLASPLLNLSMVEAPRTGINASHFGVQVATTDDVIEAKERFDSAGLRTRSEDDTACCYAVQDKVWVSDPDSAPWEIYTVLADADAMGCGPDDAIAGGPADTPAGAVCCASVGGTGQGMSSGG